MGRRIIIGSAVFSDSGMAPENVNWLFGYNDTIIRNNRTVESNNMFYCLTSNITSAGVNEFKVKCVKLYCLKSGIVTIGSVNVSGSSSSLDTSYNYNVVRGFNVVVLREPITVSSTKSIGFTGNEILTFGSNGGWTFKRVGVTNYYEDYFSVDFGTY